MKNKYFKLIILLFFLIETSTSFGKKIKISQNENGFPGKLCDYSMLLSIPDDNIRSKRKHTYIKLLGIAKKLFQYRKEYLDYGKAEDIFPTIYYHMTVNEMDRIRKNEFYYSIEKMDQMIYFFEAYEYNRKVYDRRQVGKIEDHWKKHFNEVDNFGNNILCQGFRKTINSAIRAHVKYDLSRAIKFARNQNIKSNININKLEHEFLSTNDIFEKAQEKSIQDLKLHHGICTIANPDWQIWGGSTISLSEIIEWRKKAFTDALGSASTMISQSTLNYKTQPSTYPHGEYFNIGSKICINITTLFLIDRSGSMASKGRSGKPKIEEAKLAATNSIRSFNNQENTLQEVGVLSFSGGCSNSPTASQTLLFNTNMQQAQQRINAIGAPGGGTPLREAVDEVTSRLRNYVVLNGSDTPPKLIVLSDGIASCQKIRPAGVYATGNFNSSNKTSYRNFNTSKPLQSEIPVIVKYYTIGFDIKAGSEAERDLQYLAESSGGKYLNAQNEYELTRAFQKFYRVYTPKEIPALENLDSQSVALFKKGVLQIKAENYESGLSSFKTFHFSIQKDFNAAFNLALMYDANNYHLAAIEMFEKYLVLHRNAPDKDWVLKQIDYLKKDREIYLNYILQVLKSDLFYLEFHFKKIQNGESLALAEEFKGFIKEKGDFYKVLPSQLQLTKKQLEINCKEISRALQKCSKLIKQDSKNWDKNASPILSMTYLNLERLIENF